MVSGTPAQSGNGIIIEGEPRAVDHSAVGRGNDAAPAGANIYPLPRLLRDGQGDLLSHQALQGDKRGIVKIVPGEFEFRLPLAIAKQEAFGHDCQRDVLMAG